jgi:hypothetical protein
VSAAVREEVAAPATVGRREPPGPPPASSGNGGASGPPPGLVTAAWVAFVLTYLALVAVFRQG